SSCGSRPTPNTSSSIRFGPLSDASTSSELCAITSYGTGATDNKTRPRRCDAELVGEIGQQPNSDMVGDVLTAAGHRETRTSRLTLHLGCAIRFGLLVAVETHRLPSQRALSRTRRTQHRRRLASNLNSSDDQQDVRTDEASLDELD